MVVKVASILMGCLLGAFAPIVLSAQEADAKPIVIFVDVGRQALIYKVDGSPVSLFELRRTLERKKDPSKPPDDASEVVIVVHEKVTFSQTDDVRLLTRAAGYADPRVFYFGKDRRLMVEVTYLDAIAFSPNGPGLKKH